MSHSRSDLNVGGRRSIGDVGLEEAPFHLRKTALAFALDNPEVMEADVRREQEILEKAGQRAKKRHETPGQIELPFGSDSSK